jgi:hypothetical protein
MKLGDLCAISALLVVRHRALFGQNLIQDAPNVVLH